MQIAIKRCALSVALALAGASAQAADWTVRDLGTLGGSYGSTATGINASGQVVGYAWTAGNPTYHAFISAPNGGALTDLGTLGGTYSNATGINASGQVVGTADTLGGASHAFISAPNGGALRDLGTLGGSYSFAQGINASGQVVGNANTAGNAAQHAFISAPNGGALRDLGTLGGSYSYAQGINASGQVVGTAYTAGNAAQHAFISAPNGGALTDLGTLGGSYSFANGINASGQVVGTAYTAGDAAQHAFISAPNGGTMLDLSTLAAAGRVLSSASAVNDYGQVVGRDVNGYAFIATPNAKWGAAGGGSWDNAANWNFGGMGAVGFTPGTPHDVVINPAGSATVLGSANATVNSLTVAGNTGQIVTLNLNGGSTVAVNGAHLYSNATLAGNGTLGGNLNIEGGGRVYVADGQSMLLAGRVDNLGKIDVQARTTPASLQVGGLLTNAAGQINLMNADVYAQGGIVNAGRMSLTGFTTVSGVVDNWGAGQVNVSGISAHAIFWDNFRNNGSVTVTTGSTATFFGLVNGAGSFLGGGAKEFAGGYAPGNSPAWTTISGPTTFSSAITMELAGLTPGSGHDKITFDGLVTLAGADLNVLWYGGWTGHAGDLYDLFDWNGALTGTFGHVNLASLDSGLIWDTSRLYTTGEISIYGVAAVPEPETYAMLLAGLGLLSLMARRRKQKEAEAA